MNNLDNYQLMNGADLAFLGDAYYELKIREYLLSQGITKNNELKKQSVLYVSAHAHQIIMHHILDDLSAEEQNIYKRGRNNAPKNKRKNLDYTEYIASTGFEAVIGYLYLKKDQERLDYIIAQAIAVIKEFGHETTK